MYPLKHSHTQTSFNQPKQVWVWKPLKNDFQAATKTQKPKSSLKPFAMKNKSPAERKTRHGKGCAGYGLNRFGNIVKNLTVFPENMIRNMNSTFGLIFSQRAMLTLIEKGMTREQAYDLVQPKTAYSWDNQVDFKPLLEADPEVTSRLTQEEIDEIFNPLYYTKRVDDIFERLGLG